MKRAERQREIKKFEIIEQNGKDILFRAEVQGGTYIRKLVSDLGDHLGIGAHMLELRRIRAGIFKENGTDYPSVKLYDLEKAIEEYNKGNEKELRNMVIPGEIVSKIYPVVEINAKDLKNLLTGKPIQKKDLKNFRDFNKFEKDDIVCIFCDNKFIEMSKVLAEGSIFSKPEFVFTQGIN